MYAFAALSSSYRSAAEATEDLIDYEEDDDLQQATGLSAATGGANGDAAASSSAAADGAEGKKDEQKGSYVGVHSTGFRDFLLKPELLRAISDLGFEHPSEGT